jgi:hypothetical protein
MIFPMMITSIFVLKIYPPRRFAAGKLCGLFHRRFAAGRFLAYFRRFAAGGFLLFSPLRDG